MKFIRSRPARLWLWLLLWTAIACAGAAIFISYAHPSPSASVLDRRISDVTLTRIPLEQAIIQLGAYGGAPVVIDKKALAQTHVKLQRLVDLKLHDVDLRTAFEQLLIVGNADNCVVELQGAGLIFTTVESPPRSVRIYDVGDLVQPWLATAGRAGSGQDLTDEIGWLVRDVISPDDWAIPAGPKVRAAGTRLIVSASPALHRRVEALLREFRESARRQPLPALERAYDASDIVTNSSRREYILARDQGGWGVAGPPTEFPVLSRDQWMGKLTLLVADNGSYEFTSARFAGTKIIVRGRPAAHGEVMQLMREIRDAGEDGN